MSNPPPSSSCYCGIMSRRTSIIILLFSAIPIAFIASSYLDTSPSSYTYKGEGYFRECAKWDPVGNRFLASTMFSSSVVEISAVDDGADLEELVVIRDADVAGNVSVGLLVDRARNRVLVVYGDSFGNRYGAIGAYRLDSWERIFLTWLSGPDDEPSLADDVGIDPEGNAYITDAKSSKIWKIGVNGELISIIRNNLFNTKEWYKSFVTLNGIVYHPNGYFLVIHTATGRLFKVYTSDEKVSIVNVKGSLLMGDGMEMISPNKIVVAGSISTKLVESDDDWVTARVTGRYVGPFYRLASSATVKDGKVYVNHLVGGVIKKQMHVLAEAVFTPVNVK